MSTAIQGNRRRTEETDRQVRGQRWEKAASVTRLLRKEYGTSSPRGSRHPTESMIATILSQHTADRNSSAAFAALKERFGTWEEIVAADTHELARVIRSAGLANIKAARIQAVLRTAEERFGTMDLSFLKLMPLAQARETLLSLPGVGPKTAACVLLFSCGHPALPVDTHVHRLAKRLGLIDERDSAERAHAVLEDLVPSADVYDFHVNLITHGRRVCHAIQPRCGVCILQASCTYYQAAR